MLNVSPVRAFADNYIWLIKDPARRYAAIVDPGDAQPVLHTLREQEISPVAILITHHHADHIGGIQKLRTAYPTLPVYGPASEPIPQITYPLREGDTVVLGKLALSFRIMDVPGHTAGHIVYYGEGALFCGDTLFAAGCGRVFSGTFEQLHHSLSRIAQLPGDTLAYCAHEYTVDNLGFAKWVEAENPDILHRDEQALALQEQGIPTVPSRLDLERQTNPFLRFDVPEVICAAENKAERRLKTGAEVFTVLRRWKDTEYD
jgi:hydroxyacylglutathione hydrolase